jgi:DNA-binding response OmpR family regulator
MTALVVEDESLVLGVFDAVLQTAGWIVFTAVTAQAGLRLCSDPAVRIDLVIVDRQLPDLSGTDLALKILALRPGVRFLLASGTPIECWSAADLLNLAALPHGFLQKPFTAKNMMGVVEGLMSRKPALAVAGAQG